LKIYRNIKSKSPIEFFGDWAEIGKDEGMEKGHTSSVNFMINKILENNSSFTFIDAGCGNGWVTRLLNSNKNCDYSAGVDGAKQMIEKAKLINPSGNYFCGDLIDWIPSKKVDIVHSMEVFYYFKEPIKVFDNIYKNWLNREGKLVFGIDHYVENKTTLNWPEECGVYMNTKSIFEWKAILEKVGFKNIQYWNVGEKNNWNGTLVFYCEK
jgi:SAM-dependent methyltransferase